MRERERVQNRRGPQHLAKSADQLPEVASPEVASRSRDRDRDAGSRAQFYQEGGDLG